MSNRKKPFPSKMNIPKSITLSILCILLDLCIVAQTFNAGITAAVVASDVYGPDVVPDADSWNDAGFQKAGIMLGGIVASSLNKKFSIRLEINYIQKGTQQHADSTGKGYYKFSLNYAEVPLTFKYHLHLKSGNKIANGFDIHAGISAGRLIKSKAQTDNFYSIDDYSYLNRTDISLVAGFGYNFSEHFNFSVRYSNSIIPVFKQTVSPTYPTQAFNYGNNMVLHFMLQYMFGRGKNYDGGVEERNNNLID